MATKLKNLHLTSVDLVRAGANQEADICLFKSASPPEVIKPARTISKSDPDRFDIITEIQKSNDYDCIVEVEKFNPYHGKDGRFASANNATSFTYAPGKSKAHDMAIAREKDRTMTIEAGKAAKSLVESATKKEPQMTKTLKGCAESAGGQMVGLDFAVKGEGSLARKIKSEMLEKGISVEKAAANMKDVNRYTMQLTEKNFVSGYQKTMQTLESQGYEVVRVKNTLANPNAAYRGVNTNIKNPDGSIWELQFHTKTILEIKEVNHKLYEKQRLDTTPAAEKASLDKQMAQNAASIPTPEGISNIQSVNRL